MTGSRESKHLLPAFSDLDWAEYSAIQITYRVAQYKFEWDRKLLLVRFTGDYGHGASGNCDAAYMDAMYRAAFDVVAPDGLILDFSGLSYQWGDRLGQVLNPPCIWGQLSTPPFAIVLGEACEDGLRSLLQEDLGWSESEPDWVFDGVSEAQRYVEDLVREGDCAERKQMAKDKHASGLVFWELLGPESGPEQCRHADCTRLRMRDSVLCRVHHYEQVRHEPCPFA